MEWCELRTDDVAAIQNDFCDTAHCAVHNAYIEQLDSSVYKIKLCFIKVVL